MGSLVFDCPLCCGKTFSCRKSLKYHLLSLTDNLHCPECCQKLDSISSLAQHLDTKCERSPKVTQSKEKINEANLQYPENSFDTVTNFGVDYSVSKMNLNLSKEKNHESHLASGLDGENEPSSRDVPQLCNNETKEDSGNDVIQMTVLKQEDFTEDNVDLQVRLLDDSEDGSVLILSNIEPGQILCEENTDQTDAVPSDTVENEEVECPPDESQATEEIYSCNSCGISFTSVVEHIQNFHSDQEVVVEMAQEDEGLLGDMTLLQVLPSEDGEETDDADEGTVMENKRVILENGEIVSARQAADATERWRTPQILNTLHEEQCVDRDGRLYTRKVVQIERFWDSGTIKTEAVLDVEVKDSVPIFEEGEEVVGNEEEGTVSRIYYCSRCYTQYGNLQEFESHVCKPTQGKYKCEHCNVSYNNSKSLCAHMKVHKTLKRNNDKWATLKPNEAVPLGPYRCAVCDTIFPSNKSLLLHGRMHEPVRQRHVEGPVEYPPAGAEGPTVASPCDRFHCNLCDKWIHVGYRKIHESVHTGQVEYNCDICNRKFFTKENLEMHMNVHSVDKVPSIKSTKLLPYECNYCNRQFARPHEKVKHERIHTGEKPHSCDICGKSFRVSYCLTLHMRTHTGARPYVCSHCGKRFKAHSVYNHHVLTHSNVRAYKCPFCPKAFKTSVQLAGHKNSHTKPFSCTECNRPFASLYAVRVHLETHKRQNNLKYNCELCGASYARAFALRDHLKAQHNSVPDDHYLIPEDKVAALAILQKNDDDDVLMEKIDVNGSDEEIVLDCP